LANAGRRLLPRSTDVDEEEMTTTTTKKLTTAAADAPGKNRSTN